MRRSAAGPGGWVAIAHASVLCRCIVLLLGLCVRLLRLRPSICWCIAAVYMLPDARCRLPIKILVGIWIGSRRLLLHPATWRYRIGGRASRRCPARARPPHGSAAKQRPCA